MHILRPLIVVAVLAVAWSCSESERTPASASQRMAAATSGPARFRGTVSGIEWEGERHFFATHTSNQTEVPATVEILEFFWYACPHCYTFEPRLVMWNRGNALSVRFERIPVVYTPQAEAHARLFYALKVLHREDLHTEVFEEIFGKGEHLFGTDEGETLARQVRFATANGISELDFRNAYRSNRVDAEIARAARLSTLYHVDGTPTIIVNGKFRTHVGSAGSEENLIALMADLAAEELRPMRRNPANAKRAAQERLNPILPTRIVSPEPDRPAVR
jgi:protein dithiol oxidoreductase (disulfide-forming)